MVRYTLRTLNHRNEIVDESSLEIEEGSILVLQLPDSFNEELAYEAHHALLQGLNKGSKLITLFSGMKLKVLNIKK